MRTVCELGRHPSEQPWASGDLLCLLMRSLRDLKHLHLLKLSANPLVDAVDDVVNLMAVHSLIVRSAAIFF